MSKTVALLTTFIGALIAVAPAEARAQDPAVVNPTTVRVKLENSRVRVLEAVLQPGEKERLHSHPPYVVYVIAGGKARNHLADGTTTETTLQTGDVVYRDAVTHWAENVGTTTIHVILVELKPAADAASSNHDPEASGGLRSAGDAS